MASAKKSKNKSARKPSAKQHELEAVQSPEDMLKQLPAAREEHTQEVKDMGERFIALIEESKYHPTVALDALQVILSVGIGSVYGKEHQDLWEAHLSRFHEESRVLSILDMLEKKFAPDEDEFSVLEEPTPERKND